MSTPPGSPRSCGRVSLLAVEHLATLIDKIDIATGSTDRPTAPWMLASHYAPRTPLVLLATATEPPLGARWGWLGPVGSEPRGYTCVEPLPADLQWTLAAAELFAALHRLDHAGLEQISWWPRSLGRTGAGDQRPTAVLRLPHEDQPPCELPESLQRQWGSCERAGELPPLVAKTISLSGFPSAVRVDVAAGPRRVPRDLLVNRWPTRSGVSLGRDLRQFPRVFSGSKPAMDQQQSPCARACRIRFCVADPTSWPACRLGLPFRANAGSGHETARQ